jgi:protein transport protein SEC24
MIQPLADPTAYDYAEETGGIPEVNFMDNGPFRCRRCHSYVNPYYQWLAEGKKAQCNLCHYECDVPPHYYSNLNEFGQRVDRNNRPELLYGTYDIKAPPGFKGKEPTKPLYVMLLDVSLQSYETGYLH